MRTHLTVCILVLACIAAAGFAQTPPTGGMGRGPASAPATQSKPAEARTDSSTTTAILKPSGRPELAYTAVAGYLPLKDETEKLRANMFYVSYTAGVTPAVPPVP